MDTSLFISLLSVPALVTLTNFLHILLGHVH